MGDYPITIRESLRAKRVRITVYPDGRVIVTVPKHADPGRIQDFIRGKSDWIGAQLASMSKKKASTLPEDTEYSYLRHRPDARLVAEQKVSQWNALYRLSFERIEIKRMSSRWGSCSGKGTLCFNYRILFLPEELQDYLVVHELCHLAEMNHSARFWKQVGRHLPQYAELRRALRLI